MTATGVLASVLRQHSAADLAMDRATHCIQATLHRTPPPFTSAVCRRIATVPNADWLRFDTPLGDVFAARSGLERPPGPSALHAARLVHFIDPLLDSWETQIKGLTFLPSDHRSPSQHCLCFDVVEDGASIVTFAFTRSVTAPFEQTARTDAARRLHPRLPVTLRASLSAPTLTRANLRRLLPGGALLLGGGGSVIGQIDTGGQPPWSGIFDYDARTILILRRDTSVMTINDWSGPAPSWDADDVTHDSTEAATDRIPIPLHVRLPSWTAAFGTVERMMPGDIVPLPRLDSDTPVVLMAGELPLAHGRLILIGEAVALLIDRLQDGGPDRG